MSFFKGATKNKTKPQPDALDRSVYVSNSKIDKEGQAWTRKSIWFRQDHLNKLKVIAHFERKTTQLLVDRALGEFISRTWDDTMARQKLVQQSDEKR